MQKEKLYSKLHNLYQISKTLRFELIPIGETREFFEKEILEKDELRSQKFKIVKKYCDQYHKAFIENCLNSYDGKDLEAPLKEYYSLFNKKEKTDKETEQIEKLQKEMRKKISERFSKCENFKNLFDKDLIRKNLKEYYKNDKEKLDDIEFFNDFTTYFVGYNDNRKNIYTQEAIPTAISYRLIHENLVTYIKNLENFNKVLKEYPKIKEKLYDELKIDVSEYLIDIKNFTKVLSQSQIDKYNLIIGGKSPDGTQKAQGLNELINLYNQKNKTKLPKLKELYKQILSDRTSESFKIEKIENDLEMVELINNYYSQINEKTKKDIVFAYKNINQFNLNEIFIENSLILTSISKLVYKDWNYINSLLEQEYSKNNPKKEKENPEKYFDKRETEIKKIKVLSIQKIEDLIEEFDKENKERLIEYFKDEIDNIILEINKNYKNCETILSKKYEKDSKKLISQQNDIDKIKEFLDSIKKLQEFIKIIIPKDAQFAPCAELSEKLHYDTILGIIDVYNKTRNYLTQKPYKIEKFPLMFNNSTLCNGWDLNKETDNLGVLFKKDDYYYLGIINKKDNKIFKDLPDAKEENSYQKIEYKLLPGANKMLPKVFFSKSRIEEFNPSAELQEKYNLGYHKKGDDFDIKFCHQLIDFFKESIEKHEDWKNFNFKFSETSSYSDISRFYREVEQQGYKITFKNISNSYVNQLVQEGKLFLFKIYNKDFSPHSKGTPNLHTMYFKALFDKDNLENVIYQLNGGAELFFRKKSLDAKVTHPKNKPMLNKNPLNSSKERTLVYDLIKDKRFTTDKFFFHVPITLNFKAQKPKSINNLVNDYIRQNDDINIIGIDRGERNLLYISVINSKGEILEQFDLNTITNCHNNETYRTDYHSLLNKKEEERDAARKSWKTIGNIKELKEGYLSQVIHKIVELMVKYNAIIILEDLNSGFKNSRKKVEKQIYDKFEKMLQMKLSYVVDKKANKFDDGGLLKAYQLVNKETLGRQSGVLFYIPAWNTSKIDPTTGFVNLFSIKETSKIAGLSFVEKIDDIKFNKEGYFEFYIDYSKLSEKSYGKQKYWTLSTYGTRIKTFRNPEKNNNWDNVEINLTDEFRELFKKYEIDLNNIKQDILNKADAKFFSSFFALFRLMLQMRNSITNSSIDYIISPVKNKNNEFYDSRKQNNKLPLDADANGAYNIARKGLMLVNRIKQTPLDKKIDYKITNQDWLEYAQNNCLE